MSRRNPQLPQPWPSATVAEGSREAFESMNYVWKSWGGWRLNSGKIFLQMTSYSLRFKVFNFAPVKKLNYHICLQEYWNLEKAKAAKGDISDDFNGASTYEKPKTEFGASIIRHCPQFHSFFQSLEFKYIRNFEWSNAWSWCLARDDTLCTSFFPREVSVLFRLGY